MKTKTALRVGGMVLGYYLICPRKAWLSLRGLWMEGESDTVAQGRLLDEHTYGRSDKHIALEAEAPCGTRLAGKIDWANLKEGVLHETKKGRSCEEAHRWQLRFYLWLLQLNGVTRPDGRPFSGQINYPALRKTETVTLTEDDSRQLTSWVQEIGQLAYRFTPPERIGKRSFCRKCAFEELCYG